MNRNLIIGVTVFAAIGIVVEFAIVTQRFGFGATVALIAFCLAGLGGDRILMRKVGRAHRKSQPPPIRTWTVPPAEAKSRR